MFSGLKNALRRCFALTLSEELKTAFAQYRRLNAVCIEAKEKLAASQRWSKELERQTGLLRQTIDGLKADIGALRGELAASKQESERLTGLLLASDQSATVAGEREQLAREQLDAAQGELTEAKHEIEMLGHQLECAEAHNTLLSEIHSTDVERRKKERAIEIRGQIEAESATRFALTDAADAA